MSVQACVTVHELHCPQHAPLVVVVVGVDVLVLVVVVVEVVEVVEVVDVVEVVVVGLQVGSGGGGVGSPVALETKKYRFLLFSNRQF